jgi:hypothetical protein
MNSETVTISKTEYDVLREVYEQTAKQSALVRVMRSLRDAKRGAVKKFKPKDFLKQYGLD